MRAPNPHVREVADSFLQVGHGGGRRARQCGGNLPACASPSPRCERSPDDACPEEAPAGVVWACDSDAPPCRAEARHPPITEELSVHHKALRAGSTRPAEVNADERDDLLTTEEKQQLTPLRRKVGTAPVP